MENPQKSSLLLTSLGEIMTPKRWEAPDRRFVGHRDIITRSMARYQFINEFVKGHLIEIGCGRGYGCEYFLTETRVNHVFGVDITDIFLREANILLPQGNFVNATGKMLPFKDASFDAIIAFEVIEHISDDLFFIREVQRIARSGAFVAISTPNKKMMSGNSDQPLDRFHVREYDLGQFTDLIASNFTSYQLFGQSDGMISTSNKHWLDRVPIRWKYLMPAYIQGYLSSWLRPPLRLSDCIFSSERLNAAHSFIALCSQ